MGIVTVPSSAPGILSCYLYEPKFRAGAFQTRIGIVGFRVLDTIVLV